MYHLYINRGTNTESLVWSGNSLAVGLQRFNNERSSSEPGEWEVLELILIDGDINRVEKVFRWPS